MNDAEHRKKIQKLYYEKHKNTEEFKKRRYEYYATYCKNRMLSDVDFKKERKVYLADYYKNITKKKKQIKDEERIKERKERLLLQILIADAERN